MERLINKNLHQFYYSRLIYDTDHFLYIIFIYSHYVSIDKKLSITFEIIDNYRTNLNEINYRLLKTRFIIDIFSLST